MPPSVPHRVRSRLVGATLAAALVLLWGGCDGECSFDTVRVQALGRQIVADVTPTGDELAVVFVTEDYQTIDVFVRAGLGAPPRTEPGDRLEMYYDLEGSVFEGETPPTFTTETAGDTVYVYTGATFDALVRPACSPPELRFDLRVTGLLAPEGVQRVSVTTMSRWELSATTRAHLRQRAADHQRWQLTTI